jgi:hypothetical protein
MIKIENSEVMGWEAAIRGMRNPMNSWEKSDSHYECRKYDKLSDDDKKVYLIDEYIPGPNDLDLMTRLRNAGTDHRKFMRMITVYLDITAPLYWWKEFDTYKVGTVANSCSTMHKIHAKMFTINDFSCEHLMYAAIVTLSHTIDDLNQSRRVYLYGGELCDKYGNWTHFEPKDKKVWWQMIQLLPSSYNQKRTVMLNYEVLANIYKSRKNHKLDEWHDFCDWVETLPYSELITGQSFNDIPICNDILDACRMRISTEAVNDRTSG